MRDHLTINLGSGDVHSFVGYSESIEKMKSLDNAFSAGFDECLYWLHFSMLILYPDFKGNLR